MTRLSSIKAIDLNLEIIIEEEGKLLAYRYDQPEEMLGMEVKNGLWHMHEGDSLEVEVKEDVQDYIVKVRFGGGMN